jgi:hypothetical protein
LLSQQAGFPVGRDLDFWLQASRSEPLWLWPGRLRSWLSSQKDALSTIQITVTILALAVGALWTWWLFDPVAQRVPNLYVTQSAETKKLGQDSLLLHITFILENTGKRTAFLTCAALFISRVSPSTDEELKALSSGAREVLKTPSPNWPVIKAEVDENLANDNFFVEVGNKTQYTADFVLPTTIANSSNEKLKTVQIYSNFQRAIACAMVENLGSGRSEMSTKTKWRDRGAGVADNNAIRYSQLRSFLEMHRALLPVAAVILCLSDGAFVASTAYASGGQGNAGSPGVPLGYPTRQGSTVAGSPGLPQMNLGIGSLMDSSDFLRMAPARGQVNSGSPGLSGGNQGNVGSPGLPDTDQSNAGSPGLPRSQ